MMDTEMIRKNSNFYSYHNDMRYRFSEQDITYEVLKSNYEKLGEMIENLERTINEIDDYLDIMR